MSGLDGQRELIEDRHARLRENANPDCGLCRGRGMVEFDGPTPTKSGAVACSWCYGYGEVNPMRPIWPGASE